MPKYQIKASVADDAECDLCHRSLLRFPAFYDGATARGPWAWMCQRCFRQFGLGLGPGRGQEYDSTTKNKLNG